MAKELIYDEVVYYQQPVIQDVKFITVHHKLHEVCQLCRGLYAFLELHQLGDVIALRDRYDLNELLL